MVANPFEEKKFFCFDKTLNYTKITSPISSNSGTNKKYRLLHVQRPGTPSTMTIIIACLIIAWCCQVSGGAPPLSTAGQKKVDMHIHVMQDGQGVSGGARVLASILASIPSLADLPTEPPSGEEKAVSSSLSPWTRTTKEVDIEGTSPLLTLISSPPPPPLGSPTRGRSLGSNWCSGKSRTGVHTLPRGTTCTLMSTIYMSDDLFDT